MDVNPYEAPQGVIQHDVANEEKGPLEFYVVAKTKFFLLYIATLGFYSAYWSYKNWAIIKKRRKLNIWPFMRGLFLIFFMHSLMERVIKKSKDSGLEVSNNLRLNATFIVIFIIGGRILDRMSRENIGFPMVDILAVFVIFVLSVLFWNAQKAINIVSQDPTGSRNAKLTAANIFWLILGLALWGLIAIGTISLIFDPEIE